MSMDAFRQTMVEMAEEGDADAAKWVARLDAHAARQKARIDEREREVVEQTERERVRDLHLRLTPTSLDDVGVLGEPDISRLGPWVEGPDCLRYRLLSRTYVPGGPVGPFFVEGLLRPHLDGCFELRDTPRLFEVIRTKGLHGPDYAETDFATLVKKANHDQIPMLVAVYDYESSTGTAPSAERARRVDQRLRALGVNLRSDDRQQIDALRERVRRTFGLEPRSATGGNHAA
jgi:hypothetical protein